MIGSSKNKSENYPRKCFRTQEKETRVKFNVRLSANRPSNNWTLESRNVVTVNCMGFLEHLRPYLSENHVKDKVKSTITADSLVAAQAD